MTKAPEDLGPDEVRGLAGRAQNRFETADRPRDLGERIACRAGCAFCCHSLVSVLPPEAFSLARHLEEDRPIPEALELMAYVRAHHAAHGRKDGATRTRERVPCPFLDLESWLCRIHAERPLTCRGMNSVDVGRCREAYETGDPTLAIPTVLGEHATVQELYDEMGTALADAGLPADALELAGALVAIWSRDDALGDWLAGEDIFAGCRVRDVETGEIPRF